MKTRLLFTIFLSLFLPLQIASHSPQSLIRQAIKQEKNGYHALSIAATNKIIDRCEKNNMQYTDSFLVMQAYTIKAKNYNALGDLAKSLTLYKSAIKYAEYMNKSKELADLYNNVFSIYYKKHNYTNAKDLLRASLDISLDIKDTTRIRRIYNNSALVEYELHNYSEALRLIDKAMQYTSISDNIPVSLILTNKAEIYFKMGKLDLASQTLTEALKKQNNKITEMTIQTVLNYALVKACMGDAQNVRKIINKLHNSLYMLSLPKRECLQRTKRDKVYNRRFHIRIPL